MAHSDDATKSWIKAIPIKNSDGNVIEWKCDYRYTLTVGTKKGNIKGDDGEYNDDYIHTFNKSVKINRYTLGIELEVCYILKRSFFDLNYRWLDHYGFSILDNQTRSGL